MNEDDLAITHRSSVPYKEMRRSVAEDKLLVPPYGDLTFRIPAGIGFLSKDPSTEVVTDAETFVVLSEYTVQSSSDHPKVLDSLRGVAKALVQAPEVLSYIVFQWKEPRAESQFCVFERYSSRLSYERLRETTALQG